MKLRKLILCLLTGIIILALPNTNIFAAEEGTSINEEITTADVNTEDSMDEAVMEATDITETSEEEIIEEIEIEEEAETETEETTKTEEVKDVKKTTTKETTTKETAKEKTEVKATTKKVTTKKVVNYTKSDLRLLSALIYCEANSESYKGKVAVGIVVMNRKRSNLFPDTVKGVIYQKYQFGPVRNGSLNRALANYDNGKFTSEDEIECIKAAKIALSGNKTITVNGKIKDFSKYLYFSCGLRNYTFSLGNHQFK